MLAKFNMNKKKSKTNHMRHHTHDTATINRSTGLFSKLCVGPSNLWGQEGDRAAPATLVVVCDATHVTHCDLCACAGARTNQD